MVLDIGCGICKKDDIEVNLGSIYCNTCKKSLGLEDMTFSLVNEDTSKDVVLGELRSLVATQTKREFNRRFKIVGNSSHAHLVEKRTNINILDCPYDKVCSSDESCLDCWSKAIKKLHFKG